MNTKTTEDLATWPVEPAQAAYQAYSEGAGGRSLVSGQPLPTWQDVKPEVKEAWRAAAAALVRPGLKAEVKRLRLRPGDLAVVTVPGVHQAEHLAWCRRTLEEVVAETGAKAVVLEGGLDLHAVGLRPGDVVMVSATHPTEAVERDLRAQVERLLPGHQLLLVQHGRTIRAMTKAKVLELRDELDGILNE